MQVECTMTAALLFLFFFIFHLIVLLDRHRPSNIRSDFLLPPGYSGLYLLVALGGCWVFLLAAASPHSITAEEGCLRYEARANTRPEKQSRARDSVTTITHSEEGGGYKKTQVKGANDNAPKWPGQFSLPMPGRCRALLIPSCAATEGPARFSPGPFI